MADSLAVAMRPAPFKCKKKGDQEQMLQDFSMYRRKIARYLVASKVVIAHTGVQTDSTQVDHVVCDSCKQEKAIMLMLGGDEMEKLFDHVGKVVEADTFKKALDKVENGIKGLTNQATARYKLFQEMPQDGQVFNIWAKLVVEQADRCDWQNYGKENAARDAILYQMEDVKLKKKILAENTALEQVIKLGIASEQASKNATRLNGRKASTDVVADMIAALEEQVRALSVKKTGPVVKDAKCKTCTRPFHAPGKCKGVECYDCGKMGHFRGAVACKKPKASKQKGKERVRSVQHKEEEEESSQEDTDSEIESSNRVVEEVVATATVEGSEKQVHAKLNVVALDRGRPSQQADVQMLIDSGVHKTLMSEKDSRKIKCRRGDEKIKLKKCRTKFRPHGTDYHLPILGRSKCILTAEGGRKVATLIYVVKGECQSLLGLKDGKDLGIVRICPQGFNKEEGVAQLSSVKKEKLSNTGMISGGEEQMVIDINVKEIVSKYDQLFTGIGRAKVEPVHIDVDPAVKPTQQ